MPDTCTARRADISALLDDELDRQLAGDLRLHVESCPTCRAHMEMLGGARSALRVRPSEDVPDLTSRIMTAVAEDGVRARRRDAWRLNLRLGSVAAAATALLLIGTSAPLREGGGDVAGASEISRAVRAAASQLDEYHSVMRVTERGWHPEVPQRNFRVEVWFEAPESLRIEIRDRTEYPAGAWPRNDVTLVADPDGWALREPSSCPVDALPGCSIPAGRERRAVSERPPFDGTTALPTDLIVPLETLASNGRFDVVETVDVGGREAYRIALAATDAAPLIAALQPGGSWRPVAPGDRAEVLIDADSWFPLGLDVISRNRTVLRMRVVDLETEAGGVRFSPGARASRAGGFVPGSWTSDASAEPTYTGELDRYRTGRLGDVVVASYSDGMTWLKVTRSGRRGLPDDPGQPLELTGGVVAYYTPAGSDLRRTLDIYGARRHLRLESNLPRAELVRVAASLDLPDATRTRPVVSREDLRAMELVKLPAWVPSPYRFSHAAVAGSAGNPTVIAHFSAPEIDLSGEGLAVTVSEGLDRLPPTAVEPTAVQVRGVVGRWFEMLGELEWIEDGVYRSVSVGSLDLPTALRIAESLR